MKVYSLAAALLFGAASAYELRTYSSFGDGGRIYYGCGTAVSTQATWCASSATKLGHHKRDVAHTFEKRAKGLASAACFCTNINALATLAGCYAMVGRNSSHYYDYFWHTCDKLGHSLDMANMTSAYEYYAAHAESAAHIANFSTSSAIKVPLLLNASVVHTYVAAYDEFYGNYDDSMYWGYGLVGYWGLMAFVSMVANWSMVIFPNLRRVFDGKVSRMWRKHVALPALVKKKRAQAHRSAYFLLCLVPSRLESLTILGFFWLTFALCAANIFWVKDDPVMVTKARALNRYVADRTGIMCILVTPLLLLFGGRNNFLQWVTGWKFSTMITFHRWIARIVVLLAVIHACCFSVAFQLRGTYKASMKKEYVMWGIAAVVAGGCICFQGLLFLRRSFYEVFLVLHILLAAFFVIGAWYHTVLFKYSQIFFPMFAVWGFDRLVRLGRMAAFGFRKATFTLHADDTLKIEVKRPSYWKPVPGGHAWVHILHGMNFFQSHPFTYVENGDYITFYCRVKTGITRSLHKKLYNLPGKTATIRVCVEGPYGMSSPVTKHSDVEFLAGGSGAPGLFSELQELVRRGPDSKQRLRFTWIIRELKSFVWMYSEFQKLKNTKVEFTVYITRPDLIDGCDELASFIASDSDSSKEKDEKFSCEVLEQLKLEFPNIVFINGRPDVEGIVRTAVVEAAHSVAVVACGHPEMVDEVRYQCVDMLDKTNKRVDFYQAMEVWA